MNCPVCDNVRMREVDREGVTIDICPQCKGVWLDRGELDKLMSGVKEIKEEFNEWQQSKYNNYNNQTPYREPSRPNPNPYPPSYRDYEKERYHDKSSHYKHKKKKNILDRLGDIFD